MTSLSSSNRKWAAAHSALQDLLQEEVPIRPTGPQLDRQQLLQDQAVLYLKYLQIFRRLEEVYEQMVHPQKRWAVRMVLDGLTGRLLEIRTQLVDLELSEYHYFDDLLLDLKMTPKDLEIPVPRYFQRQKIQLQTKFAKILETQRTNRTVRQVSRVQSLSLDQAVRLLQVSERARQGRIRAQFMRELIQSERGIRRRTWEPSKLTPDQAAVLIQKVWRGHSQRNRTNRIRTEEMVFLGMIPAGPPGPGPAQLQARQVSASLKLIQDQNEEEYQRAQLNVKQSVLDVEGTDIRETLQDQIRQWFIECRDATGKFPEFPDDDIGGSAALFSQKTPEQVLAELAEREEEREKKKKKKKEQRGGPETKKDKTGQKKKKKKKETKEDKRMNPGSQFLPDVIEGDKIFTDVWRCRDEHQQSVDIQLLREDKRQEVEQEVRLQVDELMRAELKNLRLVVEKMKMKTKTGSRKKKNKTKKKKKKRKDLTADRSLQSLCEELILEGLLIQPMNIKLSDYIGECSYLASTLRQMNIEPMPSLADVRQLIAMYAVLPLGSPAVLEKFPVAKTLLLAGPSGVGKKMLVHAVCSETGAHLIHLSPAHLDGYPGRGGATYLLHLVFKVAGELQPSVIWIEDAEKTFLKKTKTKDRKLDPRRLKKDLLRCLKTLNPKDRVLVIGTTRRPFDADVKPLCEAYKKIILIPRPDYSSRLVLWRELLLAEGAEPGMGLDLSSLAKITDGFTQGHILQAVRSVLRPRRLKKLRLQPLAASEFIQSLSKMEPVYREEEKTFKVWFSKTPLGRRRTHAAKTNKEEEGGGGGKGGRKTKSKVDKNKMKKKKK